MTPISPAEGDITDMESMSLDQKITYLRGHHEWKCQKKRELLREHKDSWKTNGLADLGDVSRMITGVTALNDISEKITVDIGLNGNHWSNNECSLDYVIHSV